MFGAGGNKRVLIGGVVVLIAHRDQDSYHAAGEKAQLPLDLEAPTLSQENDNKSADAMNPEEELQTTVTTL